MSEEQPREPSRFWQINIGHIVSMLVTVFSFGVAYQSMAGRMENAEDRLSRQEQASAQTATELSAIEISEAASNQDRVDLHKTIEDDFSRRLSKLEDKLESERETK